MGNLCNTYSSPYSDMTPGLSDKRYNQTEKYLDQDLVFDEIYIQKSKECEEEVEENN